MNAPRRLLLPACLALLAACGGDQPAATASSSSPPAPAAAPAAGAVDLAAAQAQFDSLCFACHGATGHGDGPGAGALNPKPRSFADAAWQDSVTDEQIQKAIVYGGAAVGKSPMMPAQPQLKGQQAMLDGLTKIIRGFRGK